MIPVPDHPTSHNDEDDCISSYDTRIKATGKEAQSEGNSKPVATSGLKADTDFGLSLIQLIRSGRDDLY
jgi:hypothetical protein